METDLSRYQQVTESIRVTAMPEYLPENSDIEGRIYAYSYTILIENLGPRTVQLMQRHWIIYSGGIQFAEVTGPGVVGQQPTLRPGEGYEYTSGAVIHDPVGNMEGTYAFRDEDGKGIVVLIPKFDLICPDLLN